MPNIKDLFRILNRPKSKEIADFISWGQEHAVMIDPVDGLTADIENFRSLMNCLRTNVWYSWVKKTTGYTKKAITAL